MPPPQTMGKGGQQALEQGQSNKTSSCFKGRWMLFISMSLSLTITAILIAILTLSLLESQDECQQNYEPQHAAGYRLFATKTAYSAARQYLAGSGPSQRPEPQVPHVFSRSLKLAALHESLTGRSAGQSPGGSSGAGCRVRQLHYFGRHAARFPSSDAIDEMNSQLGKLQARLNPAAGQLALEPQSQQQPVANGSVCFDPLAQYKQWSSIMSPDQGNLVVPSGLDETLDIARRLKMILPEMFQANVSRIVLGTTGELRTAQTALMFIKQLDHFQLDLADCRLDQFPDSNVLDRNKALDLLKNHCYQLLLSTYNTSKLSFHKSCRQLHQEAFPIIYHLNLNDPDRIKHISSSVSKKLKLAKESQLSAPETKAIYSTCMYESAILGSSIWCQLFSTQELRFLEYLNDINDYFNEAYGHPDLARSACPLTRDLMASFKAVKRGDRSRAKPESHFYFTHSEVLQKLLAASVDLEQDPDYTPKNVLANLKAGLAPRSRQWQTSLFTPFSGNIAFILYECPRSSQAAGADQSASIEFDAADSPFKVVASVNERPIHLDGCSDVVCDLNELLTDSRIDREKRCKMEEICKKNILVS